MIRSEKCFDYCKFSVEKIYLANPSIQNPNQLFHYAKLKILFLKTLFFNLILMSRLVHTSYYNYPNAKLFSEKLDCYDFCSFNVTCDLFITLLFKIRKLYGQIKLSSLGVKWYNAIVISELYNKSVPFDIFQF